MNEITHTEPATDLEERLRNCCIAHRGLDVLTAVQAKAFQSLEHRTGMEWIDGENSGFAPLDDYDIEEYERIFA